MAIAHERILDEIQRVQEGEEVKGAGHHARDVIVVEREDFQAVQAEEHFIMDLH